MFRFALVVTALLISIGTACAEPTSKEDWQRLGGIVAAAAYATDNCPNLRISSSAKRKQMAGLGYDDASATPEMMGRLLGETATSLKIFGREDKLFNCGGDYLTGFLLHVYGPAGEISFLSKR